MENVQHTATVLVVDDVKQQRESLKRLLSKKFNVEMAASVAETLEKVDLSKVDVAIVDFHMPDEDGLKLVGALKAHLGADRIFILTADEALGEPVVNTGDYTYLAKEDADDCVRFVEIALRKPKK